MSKQLTMSTVLCSRLRLSNMATSSSFLAIRKFHYIKRASKTLKLLDNLSRGYAQISVRLCKTDQWISCALIAGKWPSVFLQAYSFSIALESWWTHSLVILFLPFTVLELKVTSYLIFVYVYCVHFFLSCLDQQLSVDID